jgi:hypothetical protein
MSVLNFVAFNISIEGTGLMEVNYEPNVFAVDNHFNLINCTFNKINCFMTGKNIKGLYGEKDDVMPLGVASVLNVRGASAEILPIHLYDCVFNVCSCSV